MKRKVLLPLVIGLITSCFSITAMASSVNTDDLILADLGTRYDYVNMFSEGVSLARGDYADGRYGIYEFIDPFGNIVLDVSDYVEVSDFCDGLAYFEKDIDGDNKADYSGYMDRTGEEIIASSAITSGEDFSDGVAWVKLSDGSNKYYVLIDTDGYVLLKYDYYSFTTVMDYHDGLCYVKTSSGQKYFIDKEGNAAFSVTQYDDTYVEGIYDGLAVVSTKEGDDYFASWFGFVDETGEVQFSIDVPDNTTYKVKNYSDGIILVEDSTNDIYYYYNTDGEIVFTLEHPQTGGSSSFGKGTFAFFDGLATVRNWVYSPSLYTYYQYVDTNGNVVFTRPDEWEIAVHGYGTFSSGVTVVEMNGNTILVRNPLYSEEDLLLMSQGIEVEVEETTYGQSTLKLETASLVDMIYNNLEISITNNSDVKDVGTFAFVATNNFAIIHFIEYELEPYSTQTVTVQTASLFSSDVNMGIEYLSNGWEGVFNATFITFDDDADMLDYFSHVAYEQNETYYKGAMNMNQNHSSFSYDTDTSLICHSDPGTQWLADYTDISYITIPFDYEDADHSICEVD